MTSGLKLKSLWEPNEDLQSNLRATFYYDADTTMAVP